jgi:hypothetical protein
MMIQTKSLLKKQCSAGGWTLQKSLSHWTIEIVSKPGDKTKVDTYYCHKTTLAVGPRRSDYFDHLLQNDDRFAEGQSNTSRIELEVLAAEVFPVLLDSMHNKNSRLAVNSENAAAIMFFSVRALPSGLPSFSDSRACP